MLLVEPTISHAMCQGGLYDSQDHVSMLALSQRDFVLFPISDGQRARANRGSHWTLLATYKGPSGRGLQQFVCMHLDSIPKSRNLSRAQRLAQRVFHEDMVVEEGRVTLDYESTKFVSLVKLEFVNVPKGSLKVCKFVSL